MKPIVNKFVDSRVDVGMDRGYAEDWLPRMEISDLVALYNAIGDALALPRVNGGDEGEGALGGEPPSHTHSHPEAIMHQEGSWTGEHGLERHLTITHGQQLTGTPSGNIKAHRALHPEVDWTGAAAIEAHDVFAVLANTHQVIPHEIQPLDADLADLSVGDGVPGKLGELAGRILALSSPFGVWTRPVWRRRVLSLCAQIFMQGHGAGWDKHVAVVEQADPQCTHGGDCPVHPEVGALHDYRGTGASALPTYQIPGDDRPARS